MKVRLFKEFRLLALPASVIAFCAMLVSIEPLFQDQSYYNIHELIGMVAGVFPIGIVLLAAISFGSEFQQRTFVLLLSQPSERFRIWREKFFTAAGVIGTLSLLEYLTISTTDYFNHTDTPPKPLLIIFVLAIVCSAAFWTLMARSTMGGVAFTFMGIFLVIGGTWFLFDKLFLTWEGVPAGILGQAKLNLFFVTIGIVGVLYSFIFLWLGWRKFRRMEMRDVLSGEDISLPQTFPGTRLIGNFLRCRQRSAFGNLIRKEFRLQKTCFLIAGVFTICWMLLLGLSFFQSERKTLFETIFNIITAFYLPLIICLAGSIPLGEERTLNLTAWHLTLPPSTGKQWAIKLFVAFMTALLLGVLLPYLLSAITLIKMNTGLGAWVGETRESWPILLMISLVVVLSFWTTTLTGNTVRATLMVVLLFIGFGFVGSAAVSLSELASDAMGTPFFKKLSLHRHWGPYAFPSFSGDQIFGVIGTLTVIVALILSFRRFRQLSRDETISIKEPALLILFVFALVFVAMTFNRSVANCDRALSDMLKKTIEAISYDDSQLPDLGAVREFTIQELDNKNEVGPWIREWLKDATISISHWYNPKADQNGYIARISFKRGGMGVGIDSLLRENKQHKLRDKL